MHIKKDKYSIATDDAVVKENPKDLIMFNRVQSERSECVPGWRCA
jgi:hypothetical protein